MDELLKQLCPAGIYYPPPLPAEATASLILSRLAQGSTLSSQKVNYIHNMHVQYVIYLSAPMLVTLTHYHYTKHKTSSKIMAERSTIGIQIHTVLKFIW